MALPDFLTSVFQTEVYQDYRAQLVTPGLVNESAFGNVARKGQSWSLFVPKLPEGAFFEYQKGMKLEPTLVEGDETVLTADYQYALDILIDFADQELSSADLTAIYRDQAVAEMGQRMDQYVFNKIVGFTPETEGAFADVDINRITASGGIRAAIREAKIDLGDKNVPRTNRYVIVDNQGEAELSDVVQERETTLGDAALLSGYVGQLEGFSIFTSNLLPDGRAIYGHRDAFAFKDVLRDIRTHEAQRYYGYEVQGLYIAGGKVLNPNAIGVITY